jgi:hypothetical protein
MASQSNTSNTPQGFLDTLKIIKLSEFMKVEIYAKILLRINKLCHFKLKICVQLLKE